MKPLKVANPDPITKTKVVYGASSTFCVKRARSRFEFEDHVQLRTMVFSETYGKQSTLGAAYADTMSEDSYDGSAVFFNVYKDARIVATVRCVRDSPIGLPIEREAKVRCDQFRRAGTILEIGRFAIVREYRLNPFVLDQLLRAIGAYAVHTNVKYFLINAPQHLLSLYKKLGFTVFGEARAHLAGGHFYPAYLNVAELVKATVLGSTASKGIMWSRASIVERCAAHLYLWRDRLESRLKGKSMHIRVEEAR